MHVFAISWKFLKDFASSYRFVRISAGFCKFKSYFSMLCSIFGIFGNQPLIFQADAEGLGFLSKYTEGIGMNDPPSLFDLGCRDMAVTCWQRSDGRRRKWTQDHPACNEQKHKTFIRRQLFSLFFYYVPIPILGTLFRKEARSYLYYTYFVSICNISIFGE